jgi:hypothetical protein
MISTILVVETVDRTDRGLHRLAEISTFFEGYRLDLHDRADEIADLQNRRKQPVCTAVKRVVHQWGNFLLQRLCHLRCAPGVSFQSLSEARLSRLKRQPALPGWANFPSDKNEHN